MLRKIWMQSDHWCWEEYINTNELTTAIIVTDMNAF